MGDGIDEHLDITGRNGRVHLDKATSPSTRKYENEWVHCGDNEILWNLAIITDAHVGAAVECHKSSPRRRILPFAQSPCYGIYGTFSIYKDPDRSKNAYLG